MDKWKCIKRNFTKILKTKKKYLKNSNKSEYWFCGKNNKEMNQQYRGQQLGLRTVCQNLYYTYLKLGKQIKYIYIWILQIIIKICNRGKMFCFCYLNAMKTRASFFKFYYYYCKAALNVYLFGMFMIVVKMLLHTNTETYIHIQSDIDLFIYILWTAAVSQNYLSTSLKTQLKVRKYNLKLSISISI